MTETYNSQILSTKLGYDSFNRFVVSLELRLPQGSFTILKTQLDRTNSDETGTAPNEGNERSFAPNAIDFLAALMDVVEVDEWDKLKSQYIRITSEVGARTHIIKIGNVIEDKWLDISAYRIAKQIKLC